jgi:peroxiredoxin
MNVPTATRRWCATTLPALALCIALGTVTLCAGAVEVGERAPEFNLPATTGTNVSLKDFRGKSWVLIEFYGADFAPT